MVKSVDDVRLKSRLIDKCLEAIQTLERHVKLGADGRALIHLAAVALVAARGPSPVAYRDLDQAIDEVMHIKR